MSMRSLVGAILLAVFVLPVGAGAKESEPSLTWVGDQASADAYMTDIAKAFEAVSGIGISMSVRGASKGIRSIYAGQADLGGSGRYRLEGLPEEGLVDMLPVAWDPLVVAVHPDNPASEISHETLAALLTGSPMNWRDLGGSDAQVRVLYRDDDWSGVGYTLRKLLFADGNREFSGGQSLSVDDVVQELVAADINAVAVMGYATARRAGLKMLRFDGRIPTPESIANGDYMYYRILYLVTHPGNKRRRALRQFRRFLQSDEGRKVMHRNGVVPFLEAPHLKRIEMEQDREAYSRGYY